MKFDLEFENDVDSDDEDDFDDVNNEDHSESV